MRKTKQKRLESKGWKIGIMVDFLDLSPEESAYIEMKFELADSLRKRRHCQKLTQAQLARMVKSSRGAFGAAARGLHRPQPATGNVSAETIADAQFAFADPNRVIAEDVSHGDGEKRYYCFGEVAGGVLTVWFTYRRGLIWIFGAGYWRRGKRIYERENQVHR